MPQPGRLPNSAVYLTADSVAKHYPLSRYLVAQLVEPDAWLMSGSGKRYPVWLPATIEAHLAKTQAGTK